MRARVLERVRSPLAAADLHPVGDQVRVLARGGQAVIVGLRTVLVA